MSQQKKVIDWERVELHYRAGIKTLRQIGEECGVSHVSIQKRADKYAWSRDLTAKIQQKAQELVTKREATKVVTNDKLVTDSQAIQAYGEVLANAEMTQREDLAVGTKIVRSQMAELAALGDPQFVPLLEWMADQFNECGPDGMGKDGIDKANVLYRQIISLQGRVRMSKEISAAHGVYIPLLRKVFGLDGKDTNGGGYEELLRSVLE